MHGVSTTQAVKASPKLEHFPCQHSTGILPSLAQADIQVMPPRASGISTFISRYTRAFPAGAAHAIPDSQPTEEDPGRHSQADLLLSEQNDVRKQQRPLALLRAAAPKRARDRDEAGSKAKPVKQPRSGDGHPCRSEHPVETPGPLVLLAIQDRSVVVAICVNTKDYVSLCNLWQIAV